MSMEIPAAVPTKIKAHKQLVICAGMSALALIIIYVQGGAIGTVIAGGQALYLQVGFGLAVGAAAALAALVGYKTTSVEGPYQIDRQQLQPAGPEGIESRVD